VKLLTERHPAVLVTAGFFFIYTAQLLDGWSLGLITAGVSVVALCFARAHWFRVLRRLRYVALAICVLFAWQTPGIQIFPWLQAFSPTYDGFRLALTPLLRLVSVAAVVACLTERLSPDQWVSSFHVLAWPFELFGLSRERLAIRLRLVLDYVEESVLDWRSLLANAPVANDSGQISSCVLQAAGWMDTCLVVLIVLSAIGIGAW